MIREFDVFHARELAADMATRIGFSRPAVYRLATAVSELGNNLIDHARTGGRVSLTPMSRDGHQGIEVVVEDDGPGIADLEMAMTDGFSSDRGLGGGLPGCRRPMDEFTLDSAVGQGTRVTARLWLAPTGGAQADQVARAELRTTATVSIGVISFGIARRSANAAEVCGDMAGWWSRDGMELRGHRRRAGTRQGRGGGGRGGARGGRGMAGG